MAGEFDRFMGELLGGIAGNAMPSVQMPQQHIPQPFPAMGANNAASRLAQQVAMAQAAAQAQQAQQRSIPVPVDLGRQMAQAPMQAPNWIDPRSMASTAPVANFVPEGATRQSLEGVHGQGSEGEGYYFVEYTDQAGNQHRFFVPESYAEDLPQSARVTSDRIDNPQVIENARQEGALLEQQPSDVSVAFRNTRTSEDVFATSTAGVDRDLLPTESPVTGVKTDDQRVDLMLQNEGPRTESLTTQDLRDWADHLESEGDAEGAEYYRTYSAQLESAEIYEIPAGQEVIFDYDGNPLLMSAEDAENVWEAQRRQNEEQESRQRTKDTIREHGSAEPVGSDLPDITRSDVREGGNDALANEMERDGIYSIPNGMMLVRNGAGTLEVIQAADEAPAGYSIEIYGGRSQELQGDVWSWVDIPGVEEALEFAAPALEWYDENLRGRVAEGSGETAYRNAIGQPASVVPGADRVVAWVVNKFLPDSISENTGIPFVDFEVWSMNNPDAVIEAYENGYTDPETGQTWIGGRAVWERYSAEQPLAQRVANDLLMDPGNYALAGGSMIRGVGQSVLRPGGVAPARTTLGRRLLGTGLDVTGRALRAPDEAIDWLVGRGASGAARGIQGVDDLLARNTQRSGRTASSLDDAMGVSTGRRLSDQTIMERVFDDSLYGRRGDRPQTSGPGMSQEDIIRQAERRSLVQGEVIPVGSAVRNLLRESDNSRMAREGSDVDQQLRDVMAAEVRQPSQPPRTMIGPEDTTHGPNLLPEPGPPMPDELVPRQPGPLGSAGIVSRRRRGRREQDGRDIYVDDGTVEAPSPRADAEVDGSPAPRTGIVEDAAPAPIDRDMFEETGGAIGTERSEFDALNRDGVDADYLGEVQRGDAKNPFEGMKVGEKPGHPEWEFLGPRERKQMQRQEQNRMVDTIYQDYGSTPAYRIFGDLYEPSALRYVASEKRAFDRSVATRVQRGGKYDWGFWQRQALNDGRHIVDDLIPAYRSAFGANAVIPEYRFKNPLKKRKVRETDEAYWARQNDGSLIESAIFDLDDEVAHRAKMEVAKRATGELDPYFYSLNPIRQIDSKRRRYLAQRSGTDPVMEGQARLRDDGGAPPSDALPGASVDAPVEAPPSLARVRPPRQATPAPTPSSGGARVRLDDLYSTASMTDEQLAAAGLPRLQPRGDSFDLATVEDLTHAGRWDDNLLDPIVYTRGEDGRNYIVAGHSRVESARRLGHEDIPARYVPGDNHEYLLRIATETNTNTRRFTPLDSARLAGDAAESGANPEDIARRLGLQNQARGSLGTSAARDLTAVSRLDRDRFPRLAELVDQGDIDISTAARISTAIEEGVLGNGEITTILRRMNEPGGWSPDDVRRLIDGRRAIAARQSTSQVGLFGDMAPKSQAESLVDDIQRGLRDLDPNASQLEYLEGRLQDVADARRNALRQFREDYPEAVGSGRGANRYSRDNVDQSRHTQYDRDMQAINDLGEILDIPEARRLIDSATGSYGYSTAIPGGPQISRAVERMVGEVPEGGILSRQVDNPAYRDPVEDNPFVSADTSEHQYVRGRNLSQEQKRAFNYRFEEGDTLGERWDRYTKEIEAESVADTSMTTARAEEMAAQRVVEDHAIDNIRNVSTKKWKKYKDAEARIARENPDLDKTTVKTRAYGETVAGDSKQALKAWDAVVAVQREMVLYNALTGYRYILTQGIGNSITALITGHGRILREAFAPENLSASYRQMNPNATPDNNLFLRAMGKLDDFVSEPMPANIITDAMDEIGDQPSVVRQGIYEQRVAEYGFGGQRHEVGRVVRDQVTDTGERTRGDAIDRPLKMTRIADKLRLGSLRLPVDKVLANRPIRDFANSLDLVQREVLYTTQLDMHAAVARDGYQEHMRRNLPRGADEARFNELWENEVPQAFGSDRIRNVFEEFGDGYAERMARDWQNSLSKVHKEAVKEVNRIFFSGNLRNIDEVANRVVFFHYWMSRATPLYTEALLRNPALLNGYYKMMNHMYEEAESGQYGDAVKGFLRIFGTPAGFNIFIRPDAYFQTVMSLDSGSDFVPENETGLGAFLRKFPFFTNPIIQSGINLMGLSGNTFPPDPLVLGNWSNATTTLLNFANSRMGDSGQPVANRYNDFWSWVRSGTSSVSPVGNHVPYTESTAYARRDVNNLIQAKAIERGLDPNSPEVLAAMDDPDSELYQLAYREYATGRGVEQIMRILPTSAFYPKARVAHGDRIRYEINNTAPGTPEHEYWRQQRTMAQTTDRRARPLLIQGDEYYGLGTDRQRKAYSTYNSIQYGPLDHAVMVGGEYISEAHLEGLSDDDRKNLADQWARETGLDEEISGLRELRSEYRKEHAEWGGYMDWSWQVREYPGGVDAWWQETMSGNPNAAQWYQQNISGDMDDADRERRLTSVDAYMASRGIQKSMYEPAPISTNDGGGAYMAPPADRGGSSSGSSSSATTADNIRSDIAEYENSIAEYNAIAGANMEGLNPMAQRAYASNMRDQGYSTPRLSTRAQLYVGWAQEQPQGSDISPEAYIRWLEQQ